MADVKVKKTRVTLVGDVDMEKVSSVLASSFPGLEVKAWSKKGKTGKRVAKASSDISTDSTQAQ